MIVELCRWIDMLILSSFGAGALAGYLNSGGGWCARWFRTTLASAFLIAGSLSFLEQVHQFTDEISWATITLVAFKTSIGSIWLIRQGIGVLLLLLALLPTGRALPFFCFIALALALSPVGHPMAAESVTLAVATHFLHLACFALWFGGLAVLITSPTTRTDPFRLARFSRLAIGMVVGLTATGLMLSWLFIPDWLAILSTTYGRILSAKLILFLAVLWVARKNKHLVREAQSTHGSALRDHLLTRRLWFEITGLFLVSALAVWLGHQMPPMDI